MAKNNNNVKMYAFLLPNGVKYRVSQTIQLRCYRFAAEDNKCSHISIRDAIRDVKNKVEDYGIDKVVVAVGLNIISDREKKRSIIEGVEALMMLKDIAPKREYAKAIEELNRRSSYSNDNNVAISSAENDVSSSVLERLDKILLPDNAPSHTSHAHTPTPSSKSPTVFPDWIESLKVKEGIASGEIITEHIKKKIENSSNNNTNEPSKEIKVNTTPEPDADIMNMLKNIHDGTTGK